MRLLSLSEASIQPRTSLAKFVQIFLNFPKLTKKILQIGFKKYPKSTVKVFIIIILKIVESKTFEGLQINIIEEDDMSHTNTSKIYKLTYLMII